MIFDWYNGGDWGGLPVRRLGHIMVDVINGCHQAARVSGKFPISFDGLSPTFLDADGTPLTGITAENFPTFAASDYDDLPIGSPIIRDNFRAALSLLQKICAYEYTGGAAFWWAAGSEGDAAITETALGIQDLTEDSLQRPQLIDPWIVLRTALERLRYLRYVQTGTSGLEIEVKAQTVWESKMLDSPAGLEAALADPIVDKMNEVVLASSQITDSGDIGPVSKGAVARAYATGGTPQKRYIYCEQKTTTTSAVYSLIGGREDRMPAFALTEGWLTFSGSGTGGADGMDVYIGENEDRIEDGSRFAVPLTMGLLSIYDNDTTLHTITTATELESGGHIGQIGFTFNATLLEATYDTDDPVSPS